MKISAATVDKEHYKSGIVPLAIGVTGHRDLVDREIPLIRERVRELFLWLQQRFVDRPLCVLSPLAEGADRLVAEVALELGLQLIVVLPMPVELYRRDFASPESYARFEALRERAIEVLELPLIAGVSRQQLLESGASRARQYAQLGVFLCAHSHLLLALWDGKPAVDVGGTAQVVRFHHYDVMAGDASAETVSPQILADDDSDLVYQIVVSRQREQGGPAPGLRPLDTFWLTTDELNPRTGELPAKYAAIFERTARFNRDVRQHAERIVAERAPLIKEDGGLALPPSVLRIDRFFCGADWLAGYYQRLYFRALKWSHGLVFLMALTFLLYSNLSASRLLMLAFGLCFAFAYSVHAVAKRGEWHGKYLEYRTLAEGLRVQFYWAAAGVTSGNITKYAHDNFLQKQDVELGWIRNVMRVAGMGCDVAPLSDPAGLALVLEQWLGDESNASQVRYYRTKAAQHLERRARGDRIGRLIGVLVITMLLGAFVAGSDRLRLVLFVLLGILLLLMSVREAYAYRIAEKDVIKQYEFMHRIFRNAKKRLAEAANDTDRRRILRVLGEAALDEHAEWILLHRERPLSDSKVWRMEG